MKLALLACGALLIGGVTVAAHFEVADVNASTRGPRLTTAEIQSLVQAEVDKAGVQPLAVALIPGPYESYGIDLYLVNMKRSEISDVTFDAFRALNNKSLLVENCWSYTPDVVLEYPVSFGRGPMQLGFGTFGFWEARAVGMDPDTYDDPSYGATVLEMVGTEVHVVFKDGTRAAGVLHATDFGVATFLFPTYVPASDRLVRAQRL